MKTETLCFTQFRFTAWSRLDRCAGDPLNRATCTGERIPLPAGTPCRIIARSTKDRVLLELDPHGNPAYGWGNVIDLF